MADHENMYDRAGTPDNYERATTTDDFPFGDRDPEGGFEVGDYVGLIYSDHDEYVFDNPEGFVVDVEEAEDDFGPIITVEVQASIVADRVFLKARKRSNRNGAS